MVFSRSISVFCVTESWLSEKISDGEILPSNYIIYRHDRGSKGGGVLTAVSREISSRKMSSNPKLEAVSVLLKI